MRTLLLYDADCGFCETVAGRLPLLRLDLDITSIQAEDLEALGIDAERAEREMPLVRPDGSVVYGHVAWGEALLRGPLPLRLAGHALLARPVVPLARRVYAWVSDNRQRLPGGTPQCALPPKP
ncbi:MAG: DCC1-like thiol-disulfide oxidoreductase family protein [Nocardioides sp.]|uniref:thiol-disulfide oxidoreductase DCC family protein n=1 Tax=Nocardioides sp. TaxID=35761 RepID=UPI0039E5A085